MTNKQVAHRLGLASKTVGRHLDHVFNKLGVSSRAGAALIASEQGLL